MADDHPLRLDTLLAHEPLVRSVARAVLRGDSEVDDVVQDTWVAALQGGPRRPGAVCGWLRSVARHRSLNVLRERRRRVRREATAARPERAPDVAEIAEREALRRRLVELMLAAKEPYRTALLLRYYEDLPVGAVAARLGIPQETVKTRIRRGLDRLRRQLNTQDHDVRSGLLGLAGLGATESLGTAAAAGGAIVSAKTTLSGIGVLLLIALGAWLVTRSRDDETHMRRKAAMEDPRPDDAEDLTQPTLEARSDPTTGYALRFPRGVVGGVVVHPDGSPISDVYVRVVAEEVIPNPASSIQEPDPRGEGFVTTSGPDGAFILPTRPAEETRLLLLREGFEMGVFEPGVLDEGSAQLMLQPGRTLAGRVQATDGVAIPSAKVVIFGRSADGRGVRFRVLSDADGGFRFRYLPAGALRLSPTATGYRARGVNLEAGPSKTPIVIAMERTGLLVHAVDAETQLPVAGVGAILQTPDGSFRMGLEHLESKFDSVRRVPGWLLLRHLNGEWTFPHPQGELYIVAPGYRTERRIVARDPSREPPALRVAMHRADDDVALAGEVTGGEDVTLEVRVPRPPTWVEGGDEALPLLATSSAESGGAFAIRGLPAGKYRLVVRSEDSAPRSLDVVAPRRDLRIDLSPAGHLVVQLTPPSAVWVHLEKPGATSHFTLRSDAAGRASFENLPPGRYRATVTPSQSRRRLMPSQWPYVPVRTDVDVAPGETTTAILSVPVRMKFTLAVVDEDGADRASVRVILNSNPGSYASMAGGPGMARQGARKRTASDGRVVYELFPGLYGVELVDGSQRRSTWIHVRRNGPATHTLTLPRRTHRIAGTVLDAETKEPIAGRRVEVTPAKSEFHETLGHSATDATGRFEIAGVPAQMVSVNVYTNLSAQRTVLQENAYPTARVALDLTGGPSPDLVVRIPTNARSLELYGSMAITVAAKDADSGAPIDRGSVSVQVLRDGIWFSSSWGRFDQNGRTDAIIVPRAERYRLEVHGGFNADPPYARAVLEQATEEATLHVDVELDRER